MALNAEAKKATRMALNIDTEKIIALEAKPKKLTLKAKLENNSSGSQTKKLTLNATVKNNSFGSQTKKTNSKS